jgi:hypothetical protein
MEMAFASQDDVFSVIETVLPPIFEKYGAYDRASKAPFDRIPFKEAMEKYGSDKPDLRIDLELTDVTELLSDCGFEPFKACLVIVSKSISGRLKLVLLEVLFYYDYINYCEPNPVAEKLPPRGSYFYPYDIKSLYLKYSYISYS